jgi:hypothetical protein
MFDHVFGHQFECTLSIEREEHVATYVALLTLEEGCLLNTHSLHIAIEVVYYLTGYPLNLLNVIDTCLFEQALILAVYRFNRRF